MADTFTAPGGSNTYTPSFTESGRLSVSYSRNVNKFALNSYVTLIPTQKQLGLYHYIDPGMQARARNEQQALWPDGADALENKRVMSFEYKSFQTKRHLETAVTGDIAIQSADWDVLNSYNDQLAQLMMTLRTEITAGVATDTNQMVFNSTATSLGGGYMDKGTSSAPYLRTCIINAVKNIVKNTTDAVSMNDLVCVLNPNDAEKIGLSTEIIAYLVGSPYSLPNLLGGGAVAGGGMTTSFSAQFGLPPDIAGVKFIVDATVKNKAQPGEANDLDWVWPDHKIAVLARPGSLVSTTQSYSTLCMFMKEELAIEQLADYNNRRVITRCVDDYAVVATAPASGYLITEATSV